MPFELNVTLPFDRIEPAAEFQSAEAVAEIGAVLDRCGFHAAVVTDHPAPTGRWLDASGHHAHDPFVMLAMVAGATKRIRLQTGIVVLPYRNPFITARAVASLDVFSGGRVCLGLGAGYLKGEYRALGADFDNRNALMDEYILAMKAAWTEREFSFKGTGYEAQGVRILPLPLQKPHPPLYIGGNSKRAIRRAVDHGDAWEPYFTPAGYAQTSRTAQISNDEELAQAIGYMRDYAESVARPAPQVILSGLDSTGEASEPQALIDRLGRLWEMGVSRAGAHFGGRSRAEWCDAAERFQAEIIAKL
jgi:probable F420-dependent oxidoreductase